MMIDGIDTFTDVTAILSCSVRSSSFFNRSARVFRYIGNDDIAATPLTFAESTVLSQRIRNAGGPAAMKSTAPDKRESFMTAGPPRSIHVTLSPWMPASLACSSIRWFFSITSRGRKPTPPAPRGMRTSVTSPFGAGGFLLQDDVIKHKDTKAPRKVCFTAVLPLLAHQHFRAAPNASTSRSHACRKKPDPRTFPRVDDRKAVA